MLSHYGDAVVPNIKFHTSQKIQTLFFLGYLIERKLVKRWGQGGRQKTATAKFYSLAV